MSRWTRRKFLKTSLAASAGAVAAKGGLATRVAGSDAFGEAANGFLSGSPVFQLSGLETLTIRERLLLDFDWRFHFGNADDPAKDFGFGAQNREATFAKSGAFPPVTRANFDDNAWQSVDLPHDWAVELPFEKGNPVLDRDGKPVIPARYDLPDHGAKPIGRNYPETSIGWYRRVFDIPSTDQGKRIALEFDGVFRHAMVMLNGHYIGEEFSGYAPFRFDVTDFVNYGEKNVLTRARGRHARRRMVLRGRGNLSARLADENESSSYRAGWGLCEVRNARRIGDRIHSDGSPKRERHAKNVRCEFASAFGRRRDTEGRYS